MTRTFRRSATALFSTDSIATRACSSNTSRAPRLTTSVEIRKSSAPARTMGGRNRSRRTAYSPPAAETVFPTRSSSFLIQCSYRQYSPSPRTTPASCVRLIVTWFAEAPPTAGSAKFDRSSARLDCSSTESASVKTRTSPDAAAAALESARIFPTRGSSMTCARPELRARSAVLSVEPSDATMTSSGPPYFDAKTFAILAAMTSSSLYAAMITETGSATGARTRGAGAIRATTARRAG